MFNWFKSFEKDEHLPMVISNDKIFTMIPILRHQLFKFNTHKRSIVLSKYQQSFVNLINIFETNIKVVPFVLQLIDSYRMQILILVVKHLHNFILCFFVIVRTTYVLLATIFSMLIILCTCIIMFVFSFIPCHVKSIIHTCWATKSTVTLLTFLVNFSRYYRMHYSNIK